MFLNCSTADHNRIADSFQFVFRDISNRKLHILTIASRATVLCRRRGAYNLLVITASTPDSQARNCNFAK